MTRPYTIDIDQFISNHAGKLTAQQIADQLGVAYGGVLGAMRRLGVSGMLLGENHPRSKLSNLQVAMIFTLVDAGFSKSEIYDSLFEPHDVAKQTILNLKER